MRCVEVSDHLQRSLCSQKRLRDRRRLLGVWVFLLSIPLSLLLNPIFMGMGFLVFFILLALSPSSDKEKILRVGLKGEEDLKERLSDTLSDDYTAFFNLPFGRGDIDCFLIGPTGAYLFDVKSHKGYILYSDGQWSQLKVGRKGRVYRGEHIKDPSLQLRRGIQEIKCYLSQHGVSLWIEGVILFTDPGARLFCERPSKGIRIIKPDELGSLFKDKKASLKRETIEIIFHLIQKRWAKNLSPA